MRYSPRRALLPRGFTLVELLVVIGIIAVLISILLPSLAAARRLAQAVKCEASLREIGHCFQMYAIENKGYAPVLRTYNQYHISYNSNPPVDLYVNQYWTNFLAKYVTHKVIGYGGTAKQQADAMRNNILWGCPSFEPFADTRYANNVYPYHTGYGMNAFPEHTPTYPPDSDQPPRLLGDSLDPRCVDLNAKAIVSNSTNTAAGNWGSCKIGRWYKLNAWTRPAERALAGDCRAYVLEAQALLANGKIPGQCLLTDSPFWGGATGETSYDFYRHGKYPAKADSIHFKPDGGKVAFNVLFADGHVTTLISREDGYRAARMRFPG